MIIDAQYDTKDVIIQNPVRSCPAELLHTLGLMNVQYLSFDSRLHQGQIIVAIEVMAEVEAFFKHSIEQQFPIAKVIPPSAPEYRWNGSKVLADNVSVGFDYRPIMGTEKLSLHSRGLAFDINPHQNPYLRFDQASETVTVPENAVWDKAIPGTLHAEHPLVKLMEGFGWEWGGHWTPESGRTDYMHFQKDLS